MKKKFKAICVFTTLISTKLVKELSVDIILQNDGLYEIYRGKLEARNKFVHLP